MTGIGLGICTFWGVIFAGMSAQLRGWSRAAAGTAALSMLVVFVILATHGRSLP